LALALHLQGQFLLAASRLGMVPPPEGEPLEAWVEREREALLDRFPGFRATLMGWPAPPAPLPDLDGEFTAERMGRFYETFLGRAARKRQGSFYTARPMIRKLLGEPLRHPQPRLLDPAMGCGAFLSEALAMRAPDGPEARWEFACSALFGVDRDPLAREIALLALWLQVGHPEGDPRRLQQNLRVGNSLLPVGNDPGDPGIDWQSDFLEPMREGGFTAVIGNPPFVNVERLGSEEKERYREAFPALQKRFDLFVPMALKALDLTRPGGHLGLVLPQAFLTQAYAETLRRRFLDETTLLRLEETAFPGASVQTVLVSACKAPAPVGHGIMLEANPERKSHLAGNPLDSRLRGSDVPETLPQAPLIHLPEARIPTRGGDAFAIALSAFERGVPLGAVAFATWGVRGVPISEFHRDAADHPACRPMIKGDGIEPYQVTWGGKFLRYEPECLYRPLFPGLFEGEKLVLRKVSGSRGLVAARDREGYYADDSVLCCQLRHQLSDVPEAVARRYGGTQNARELSGYDLSILLAVLNSRIGGLVFTMLLGNGLNVYPAAVMRMPLPPYDAQRFAVLRALVSRREAASLDVAELLDCEIDQELAILYGVDATVLC
jgi:hypothetical protein